MVLAPGLTIEAVNDAYLQLLKQPRERIVGRNLSEVVADNRDGPGAITILNLRASLLRVLESRKPDKMAVQGHGIGVEGGAGLGFEGRYWQPVNSPLFDGNGAVSAIIHRLDDVTALIGAQDREAQTRKDFFAQASEIMERQVVADWFQQAPTFMAVLTGPEHRVVNVNPAYLKLIGHRDILGKTIAAGLPDAAEQGYVSLLDEVYRSGQPYAANGAKYAMQARPGSPVSERYVDFVFQPVLNEARQVRGICIQGVDVTDRVMADKRRDALIHLTDAWRDLRTPEDVTHTASVILGETLGVSRVGYGTIDHDTQTLTVQRDWNAPGVESLAGTLALREYASVIDDLKLGRIVAIDDVERDERTAGAATALKAHSSAAIVNVPILEQGRLVALIFVNNAAARAWLTEDIALIRELAERTRTASERVRNALSMQHSEAKFRTIADAMPQMVWSTLPDGAHDYFNLRWYEFTGVAEGSTDGEGWNGIFHPDDQQLAWERWNHSLATGEEYEIQYRLRHKSGAYRWVLGRALPLYDDTGKLIRWMGTCTDIHEQKLLEEQLRRASQSKDEFLAMLAHELRNPLAPILTAAQLLKLPKLDEARVRFASDVIGRQVLHMTELVDDLLDVARVTSGLVKLERERFDIDAVIDGAVEQAGPVIEARHHEFQIQQPGAPIVVLGDKTRLVQAIANLLNNAAKYTPKHGKIALRLAVERGMVDISVSDNGNGITPELLPYVFDLFTQGERTPERAHGGLGLGLTLVKRIAALHGGDVKVQSAGIGAGSTFTISIPLAGVADA